MKKHLIALCLLQALSVGTLSTSFAASNLNPQNVSTAPVIAQDKLHSLSWLPVMPPVTQDIELNASSVTINQGNISGAVAAIALPADQGSLEITLTSSIKDKRAYVPNVLVLDEQLQPAAYFPGSYFPYAKPGIASGNRLEGTLKLTPVLGQKQIYLLIYTTTDDLARTSTMPSPAKLYAEGANNAIPDVPDLVVRHSPTGSLTIKAKTEQNSGNIMIGKLFGAADPKPVVIGSTGAAVNTTAAPAPASAPALAPAPAPAPMRAAPAPKTEPLLNETESYFNNAIKQAIKEGEIDKALRLMNEAERLGSSTARATFISSVKGKG
ncbi:MULTISPECIES: maltose operon protein MalM [Winslowiella]|uniref:maltose operon protein MalM n=1 Tax=Winslowiella TaxID=2997349 RepID=UPI0028BED69C|nr:maltose operon protein MalM [Winslowiella toletana]WNN44054.1 maltose operon protein MalM [Winslowiella toletana]